MKSKFKNFATDWLLPPGIKRLISPSGQRISTQKFWTNESFEIPHFEKQYFKDLGGHQQTITRGDDTRSCLTTSGETLLSLPLGNRATHLQIGVTADNWQPNSVLKITIGDYTVEQTHLKSIHWQSQKGRWLDLRLPVPPKATKIIIQCNEVIHITMPRWVNIKGRTPPPQAKEIKHILILVLDGGCKRILGKAHPTLHGVELTPNINHFFKNGFKANNCFSSSEWTFPSVTSFFTGLRTSRHHAFHPTRNYKLPLNNLLLAETFQSNGFHTTCYSAANRVTPSYGFNRGFDRFVYNWALEGRTENNYDTSKWISDVIGQLSTHRHDRTFTYLQLPDPHPPWNIPPLSRSYNLSREGSSTGLDFFEIKNHPNIFSQSKQLEQLRVHDLDRELGSLFSFIEKNIPDNTLVVLTADHGSAWEAFRPSHKMVSEPTLVDDRVKIDFFIKGPGIPNIDYTELCSPNIDLRPTLHNLMGFSNEESFDGIDILSNHTPRKCVISESVYNGIYEISARNTNHCLIKQFSFDDAKLKIAGSEIYSNTFRAGATDYSEPLDTTDIELETAIREHIESPTFFSHS
ncbi:sulfatase-like hydrolase/transferase [Kiloniella laminariae]|uniref:Sulfatase-like hydrolase/transferase n=1 Tax=Kiloniella laminariae TaxID=454162 RepID=A0ABT4LMJ0_9PROT|nr:sulfatase-like hydrolase/transferase [Kiloniella laminariae]MCZ4282340.1 sulfatase-like hydrolase/transferase [Kiloniella laminariae]